MPADELLEIGCLTQNPAIFGFFFFIWSLINLPMSALVISDYEVTMEYQQALCSRTELTNLHIDTSLSCARGTLQTCVSDLNGTCTSPYRSVQLFYPPVASWHVACRTKDDVNGWATGLSLDVNSFSCRVDETSTHSTYEGITDPLKDVGGWYFYLVISSITVFCCCGAICLAYRIDNGYTSL